MGSLGASHFVCMSVWACVCVYCGLANCRLILLTAVSHRHSQHLLPHLPSPAPFRGSASPRGLKHTHTQLVCRDLLGVEFPGGLSGSTVPCSAPHFTPHPAECIVLPQCSNHSGCGRDYQQALVAEFTLRKRLTFCLPPGILHADLCLDYLLVEMQPSDHPDPPPHPPPPSSSSHLPLLRLCPAFHTTSIPMCKGHPGNRAAAVDGEINKQKKRERSDGGQSLVIHRVNYRPAAHEHTPKAAGSERERGLCSLIPALYACLHDLFSLLCHHSLPPSPLLFVRSLTLM